MFRSLWRVHILLLNQSRFAIMYSPCSESAGVFEKTMDHTHNFWHLKYPKSFDSSSEGIVRGFLQFVEVYLIHLAKRA